MPCKFFKVGGCTAGASCPFSHNLPEPGQKESCAWFVKGNCKFGHKCALAHVLPGQDMSMDRKNKKAAQQAAAAAGGGGKERGGKGGKREGGPTDRGNGGKNALLAGGSTAPRGSASAAGRPPMNLPSKSAPAPPLNDTDFAALDDMEGVARSDDEQQQQQQSETPPSDEQQALPVSAPRNSAQASTPKNDFGPIGSPTKAGGAFSPGTSPRVNSTSPPTTGAGMLSSSPFSAPGNHASFYGPSSYSLTGGVAASLGSGLAMMGGRKGWGNDAYEATSPSNAFTSTLSASHQHRSSGLSASVTHDADGGFEFLGGARNLRKIPRTSEHAVVDEEMEDFIPGSLTDLLTPEERSRRMSRSNSQQPHGLNTLASHLKSGEGVDLTAGGASSGGMMGHRHSRSVPGTSLLGDLKSIWSDPSGANGLPASPGNHHRGTPSTSGLSARFEGLGLGSQALGTPGEDGGLSMSFGSPSSLSMMSPSNASAAFLPGFHQTYMAAKAKQGTTGQTSGLGRGLRTTSGPNGLYPSTTTGTANGTSTTNSLANNYLSPLDSRGLPATMSTASTLHTHIHGNTSHTYRTTPSPFDLTQSMARTRPTGLGSGGLGGVGINNPNATLGSELADDPLAMPSVLSPSTRALQSHAPGQSLPQGLAAGLSRIHAMPLTNIVSPGTPGSSSALGNGGFGVGSMGGMGVGSVGDRYHLSESYSNNPLSSNVAGGYGDWAHMPSNLSQQQQYHLGANTMMSSSPLVQSSLSRNDVAANVNGAVGSTAQRELGGAGPGAPPGLPELPGGKLSYSAAASRAGNPTPMAPPGISKPGYQQQQQQQSRAQNDDDELFDMDG